MTTRRTVPTRRISFEASLDGLPRHFAAGDDLIASHVAAGLSALFPDGEDYFVRSVRRYRDQITDPELKRQVAGFIGQEATHGREHRALNRRLDDLGYPTHRVEWLTRWGFAARERLLPGRSNLAATAALEHFTATLAEMVLADGVTREMLGDNEVKNLFTWHALEESEHKAVAFDVYRAVGGSERVRVLTMRLLLYGFPAVMVAQVLASLLCDRSTYRRGNLRRSWQRYRRSPLMQRQLWDRLRDFLRPDFHPDDRDTTALVARWREELFGAQGTLNDRLAGPGWLPVPEGG